MKHLANVLLGLTVLLMVFLIVRVEAAIDLSEEAVYRSGLAHQAASKSEAFAEGAEMSAREAVAACL